MRQFSLIQAQKMERSGERMESRVLHRQVFMPCRNKHKSLINVFYCWLCTFYNRVNKAKKGRVSNHEKGRFFFCQTNILTKRLTSREKGELAHSFLYLYDWSQVFCNFFCQGVFAPYSSSRTMTWLPRKLVLTLRFVLETFSQKVFYHYLEIRGTWPQKLLFFSISHLKNLTAFIDFST